MKDVSFFVKHFGGVGTGLSVTVHLDLPIDRPNFVEMHHAKGRIREEFECFDDKLNILRLLRWLETRITDKSKRDFVIAWLLHVNLKEVLKSRYDKLRNQYEVL